eukprot:6176886-Pleurochrysis_carterae.AAC.2
MLERFGPKALRDVHRIFDSRHKAKQRPLPLLLGLRALVCCCPSLTNCYSHLLSPAITQP